MGLGRGLDTYLSLCLIIWCLTSITEAIGITREAVAQMAAQAAHLAAAKANTSASGQPTPYYYDMERDPRQWLNAGYGYGASPLGFGVGGGVEMLLTCLLVVIGIGVIGLPFLLLIFSSFTGGAGAGGLNFIPPTTTTTVAGRKRRELDSIFPQINPHVQEKLFGLLENFYKATDKMDYIKKLIRP